jgi:DNA (cytosine-5)-methyltransferase 1
MTEQLNVDTTKTTTHVSLCAGYGGIDLGLGRAIPNLRTIAFSEIEAFACANLVAKMEEGLLDAAPIWTNLKTFPWSEFRDRVDILSGGYPCQPFSAAGKRLGRDDPRHLWPWIADGIIPMRPRVCFFENVEGHISLGLREVISELEGLGYATTWGVFSAREVGAPHQRKRVFILAYRKSEGLERYNGLFAGCGESRRDASEQKGQASWGNSGGNTWPSRPGQPQHGWEPPRVVTGRQTLDDSKERSMRDDSDNQWKSTGEGHPTDHSGLCSEPPRVVGNSEGWQDHGRESRDLAEESRCGTGGDHAADCTGEVLAESGWRQTQPSLGGASNGATDWLGHAELYVTSDNRTDELRLLGNGVVPATAARAFLTLMDQLLNEKP